MYISKYMLTYPAGLLTKREEKIERSTDRVILIFTYLEADLVLPFYLVVTIIYNRAY